jgi:hypothetical protein
MNSFVKTIYNKENDVWGYPQEYKGIQIFPIKIKDTKERALFYRLFTCPKSYINDRQILRMSYLKFLLYVMQGAIEAEDKEYDILENIIKFLEYSMRIDGNPTKSALYQKENVEIQEIYEKYSLSIRISSYKEDVVLKEIILTEDDFDNIREIVLEQNGTSIEYVESYNPKLEKDLEFLNLGNESMNFEEEIFSFCSLTKLSEIEAGEKTLYQFSKRMEREMLLKDYEIFKAMEAAGFISSKMKSKELFKHYFSHIPKAGRYDSLMLNPDEYLRDSGLSDPNSEVVFENQK